jgi:hypothetical protein
MIFLINGKARSGKDTIADYIVEKTGAKKLFFAKPLKDMSKKYFNLTDDECSDHKTEVSRRILQGLGSLFREEFDKSYWANQVIDKINEDLSEDVSKHFVISDCRYRNEIIELCASFDHNKFHEIIKRLDPEDWRKYKIEYYGNLDILSERYYDNLESIGCRTIKIARSNGPKIEYGSNHASENDLNSFYFDYLIENSGTLEDLYKKVDDLIAYVL